MQDEHHQCKWQVMPTASASEVFALIDGRINTTSTSCRGSRPSWALVGAGCSNQMQVAQGTVWFVPLCKLQLVKHTYSVYPSYYPECSNIRLHYITLHFYGILQFALYTLHYYSILQLALYFKGKVLQGTNVIIIDCLR